MNKHIEIKFPQDSIYFETEEQFLNYWRDIGAGIEHNANPIEYPCIAWRVGTVIGDWKDYEYWAYAYPTQNNKLK